MGLSSTKTLALLDDAGPPATVASNGPSYFGFVIGAALKAACRLGVSSWRTVDDDTEVAIHPLSILQQTLQDRDAT